MKEFNIIPVILFALLLSSCVKSDDFELPEMVTPELPAQGNITTIDAVKGHYNFNTNTIYTFRDTNMYFEGYVVSSDEGGNFYKKLVLQDKPENPTAGIQVLIDDTSLSDSFNFGRKVIVKLDGLSLGYNNGVMQLGRQNRGDVVAISRAILDDHIVRTGITANIVPLPLKIRDFSERYKNLFIRLEGVQFNRNLVRENDRYTFAAENFDRFDGERQLESCSDGTTTTLSTSTFSNFRSLLLPAASGNIEGVLTRNFYDDYYIITMNSPEDLDFNNGPRCDPEFFKCGDQFSPGVETVFQESFETITTQRMLETRGWTNFNSSGGSKRFEPGAQGGNRHVRISAYNTQENPLEAWLVTPPININTIENEILSFDLRASYDNATILRVYITADYTGNPLTTNWYLLDANIPVGPTNQNAVTFTRSHIDISCLEGTVHVAFRYLGAASEKTTTYDIDNVRVTGN
ncbi:hypothetical protein FHG64_10275 [Antarcticibacterium flavum]|uniref:DUF5689 domain-containing protein n=1 Tax=Antarcticibacterium flavum TaxID=2058175 RepID=A0A5B7X4Y0_9FLAO|nr:MULTISPECIES: DUF5689 domain-containing protein [Antarcticibacterium]MCM4160586.1 hypothetical protein [Antarcticibacterium sp. W02-3]QCY69752.1 hypothetical protein FHG64_10275 [Antarcticibacterium flavum]